MDGVMMLERRLELDARDREAALQEEEKKKNTGFVQVYTKGWKRLQALIQQNPGAARVFAFLAENIDGSCGAVVVSQNVMAEELGIVERTIRRHTAWLEEQGALVRIRVGSGVYAYALDPEEIWKSWDSKKEHAAFVTRTLVSKRDRENSTIKRRLSMMIKEQAGEPELPFDKETGEVR
jgi:biotin operon repressor